MAKILLYCWNDLNDTLLEKNLRLLGHDVVLFSQKFNNYDMDGEFSMAMMMEIHKNHCDFCFSFNYIPVISSICDVVGIPYISWVFDSPNLTLLSKTAGQKCNYIFVFDKLLYQGLKERGIKNCYHMPLAVDTEYFEAAAEKFFKDRYEVSFVGSLYTNQFNYFDKVKDWDKETLAECLKVIEAQKFHYKEDRIRSGLSAKTVQKAVQIADLTLGMKYEENPLDMVAMMLQKKVTVEERRELLKTVSERFDTVLYTDSDTRKLPQIKNKGKADYLRVMPRIFANSRINLNITLRSIESGIPLRALDIMACGGFLLSNYQPELAEYFEEGKELVLFYDLQDCIDKIAYYLEHEEERKEIARAGQRKVRELFSYQKKLKEILQIVEGKDES